MIPLKDNIPSRGWPVANWIIIGLCIFVFLGQIRPGPRAQGRMIERFGLIPVRVLHPGQPVTITERAPVRTFFGVRMAERSHVARRPPFNPWLTLLTCIFLHAGWLHLLGNMWFLFVFGDNVEDRLGHFGYLCFYLAGGVASSFIHLLANPDSALPTIGASGAIAAVMGAYLILYPRARVLTAIPIIIFIEIIALPAPLFLGFWFVVQFLGGFQALGSPVETAGVAWWAHIGGFVTGMVVVLALRLSGMIRPPAGQPFAFSRRRAGYRGGW